jgi:hypothetical protein
MYNAKVGACVWVIKEECLICWMQFELILISNSPQEGSKCIWDHEVGLSWSVRSIPLAQCSLHFTNMSPFHCKNHSCALCDLKEVQNSSRHHKREMIKAQSTMVRSTIKWSQWQDELDHKLKVDNRVGDNCAMQMKT